MNDRSVGSRRRYRVERQTFEEREFSAVDKSIGFSTETGTEQAIVRDERVGDSRPELFEFRRSIVLPQLDPIIQPLLQPVEVPHESDTVSLVRLSEPFEFGRVLDRFQGGDRREMRRDDGDGGEGEGKGSCERGPRW
jgi:hypothetical protein